MLFVVLRYVQIILLGLTLISVSDVKSVSADPLLSFELRAASGKFSCSFSNAAGAVCEAASCCFPTGEDRPEGPDEVMVDFLL